jgi:S-methylmethionine-dependent homocysteine/selenocysteine methylase
MGVLSDLFKKQSVVILDSAMGTELKERGEDVSLPLWSAGPLLTNPDMVREIHIENIDAGADIITTNTFRTQRRTMEKAGFMLNELSYESTAKELTLEAVELAAEAVMIAGDNVLIAGCSAPVEDCYQPELVPDTDTLCTEHYEHMMNLEEGGVDIHLAETMMTIKEISALLNQLHKSGREYMISLLCRNDNELYSGEPLSEALNIINKFSPSAVLINCIHPSAAESILKKLKQLTDLPLGVYANIGNPEKKDGEEFEKAVTADQYYKYAKKWKELGVKIIGGCCGTDPSYIKKISVLKK